MSRHFTDSGENILHAIRELDLPDAGEGMCCPGSAALGPSGCTCWEPEYDLEQATPDLSVEPVTRDSLCHDCAFRPGSPERTGEVAAAYDQDDLDTLAASDADFWCHQGMRLVTGQRHPAGAFKPQPDGEKLAYDPPTVGGVPFKADGQPGDRCAGLAAVRRGMAKR